MRSGEYTIRPFEAIDEYRECMALQEATWGAGFTERVPPAILQVSQILGGVAAGAWDCAGSLAGFVFGMTGSLEGELVHWSDMLAVRPDAQGVGLGMRLKAYQRDQVLERGIQKMFWTFDPLRAQNAYLNFTKLGAVVREYREDMYGQTDSPLHRGLATDRFIAQWSLLGERARARLGGESRGPDRDAASGYPVALAADATPPHPRPRSPDLTLGNAAIRVAIPSDVGSLMHDDMELALEWRHATRAVLTHYLARGYEVRELVRGESTSEYLIVQGS